MDEYTKKNKEWVDERFTAVDKNGIYCAHQSIYGFYFHRSRDSVHGNMITHKILNSLATIKFDSLLDAGSAEGYKCFLVREFLGVKVQCTDLSSEACKRAKAIFKIDGKAADIQDLPYRDGQFDVVLCSESLEHISDPKTAVKELLRVAKKAVVITVPHEPEEQLEHDIHNPHDAHIHNFDLNSFDYLKKNGYKIKAKKISAKVLEVPAIMVGASRIQHHKRMPYPKLIVTTYNALTPVFRILLGKRTAAFLTSTDDFFISRSKGFKAILFIIYKSDKIFRKTPLKKIKPLEIINTTVPFYYLKRNSKRTIHT
jgi:SAM-dependent methyltransferase